MAIVSNSVFCRLYLPMGTSLPGELERFRPWLQGAPGERGAVLGHVLFVWVESPWECREGASWLPACHWNCPEAKLLIEACKDQKKITRFSSKMSAGQSGAALALHWSRLFDLPVRHLSLESLQTAFSFLKGLHPMGIGVCGVCLWYWQAIVFYW